VEETFPRLLNFDQNQAPAAPPPPAPAATVVVLRQIADLPSAPRSSAGLEVFCVRRHQRSGFLGGAVVFPGGKVDVADTLPIWTELAGKAHPRIAALAGAGEDALASVRALAVAACREMLEEAGIVPVDPPASMEVVEALRKEAGGRDHAVFPAALAQRGLRLTLEKLVPWARWITPTAEPRRFDARFFLLELPLGQVGRHDDHETTMSFWAPPAEVLDRAARGEIFLAPPTSRTLELLAGVSSVAGAVALAAEQSLRPICPLFVPDPAAPFLALPGDPAHAVRERAVAGPTRFVLREGRFVSEEPPTGGAP
jgi:8-oxo-dGTP pyrophosphatase MutT (NUDIX family)